MYTIELHSSLLHPRVDVQTLYTNKFLKDLRRKALRRRKWFVVIDNLDRSIFDLVCRVVERVVSDTLVKILMDIVNRLEEALKSEFRGLVESFGLRRASHMATLALSWGYDEAIAWVDDLCFARYLTILSVDAPFG